MKKKLLYIMFLFYFSFNISSLEPYTFYDVGNFGVEMDSKKLFELFTWNASLPSIYFRDRDSDFGFVVQSVLYSSDFLFEESIFTFLDSQIFWTPILDNELNILGPYVEFSMTNVKDIELSVEYGVKYSHFSTILDKRFPSKFVYRPMDFEFGYSIFDKEFHVGYKLDISFGFQMFVGKLNSKYNTEEELIELE